MWGKLKDRVPGIAENALWDALKWLLGGLFIVIIPIVVGWMKGVPNMVLLDCFVIILVSVLFILIFVKLRRMGSQFGQMQVVSSQGVTSNEVGKVVSPSLSSQDDEKREQIEIFFKTYIQPLNKFVSRVESRVREHLRQSQTGKDQDLTVFVADYGKGIHGRVTGKLENEFFIPENGGIDPLHRKLREFCDAYHGVVSCINHLVQFSSYPLKEDPDYEKWRDQHKLFHLELRKLLGKEKDSSTLKRGLDTDWPDILG